MDFRLKPKKIYDVIAAMHFDGLIALYVNYKITDIVFCEETGYWNVVNCPNASFVRFIGKNLWERDYDKPCPLKPKQCLEVTMDFNLPD